MKNSRIKAAFGLGLCVFAAVNQAFCYPALASPQFAYSEGKWASLRDNVLEYGELADLIHEYNVTVINGRQDYDEYRGKTNDDMKNAHQRAAEKLYDASDKMMDTVDEDQAGYASQEVSSITTRLQAEQNQQAADEENGDGQIKKFEYDKQEAGLVKAAQGKMISYWQRAAEEPKLQSELTLAREQLDSMNQKAALGMASRPEQLSAIEKADSAKAALDKNQKEQEALGRELWVMTGWSYDASPSIQQVPLPSGEETGSIDLEADKEKAVDSNYSLQANERRIGNTQAGNTRDVLQRKVDNGRAQVKADVDAKYKKLQQAKADYTQAQSEYELAKQQADSADRKFALGMISAGQAKEQQGSLTAKQAAVETAGLSYSQAWSDYQWAVNGLGETGE